MNTEQRSGGPKAFAGTVLRYAGPVLLIGLGLIVARTLILSREAPAKVDRGERALAVEFVTVHEDAHEPLFTAYGTVQPRRSLVVRPTVGGPLLSVHPDLIAGGRIDAEATLAEIDPRDFMLAVDTARAALSGAEADLDVELANAEVAEQEWDLLSRIAADDAAKPTESGRRLALREPYVARRRADVASAETRLAQAELDLTRAKITAPFDAIVLSEDVEVGAQVSAGAEIARLVDRSEFLIEVNVPAARLGELAPEGSIAHVSIAGGASREARVVRWLGEVAAAGRMARVHVAVRDPLEGNGSPALLLGSYAEVHLPMNPIDRAVSVPREAVREGDVVWTIDSDDRLAFRSVRIDVRRDDDVLVTEGLATGDRVILSPIAIALEGMQLAPRERDEAGAAQNTQNAEAAVRTTEAIR